MPVEVDGIVFYNTGEACKMAKTNRDTFLRWVRERKVADVGHRDRNGWRLFTQEEVARLRARVTRIEKVTAGRGGD